MLNTSDVEILRDMRGYYTLFVNGDFIGNFDTALEASKEADEILFHEDVDTVYKSIHMLTV